MKIVYMGTPDFAVGALKSVIEAGHEVCLVVTQPDRVKAVYMDEQMNLKEIEGTELLARAICHELDHLDGHMYTEKVIGDLVDNSELKEEDDEEE